jgi:hypothetical protein
MALVEDLEVGGLRFLENEALSRGAAVAFYAATSLAPVLLIVVAIAGLVFGQDAARGAIGEELGQLLGPTGGDFIKSILERSSDPGSGALADGVITVLITASVFRRDAQGAEQDVQGQAERRADLFADPDPGRQPWTRRRVIQINDPDLLRLRSPSVPTVN